VEVVEAWDTFQWPQYSKVILRHIGRDKIQAVEIKQTWK
jgi:hypothetical protein